MDLWVVAAATGAGYIAKYWGNLTSNKTETSSKSFSFDSIRGQSDSRNLLQQIRDQTNPLRRLADTQDTDCSFLDVEDLTGVPSTSTSQRQVENYENFTLLLLTSFPPVLAENENFRVIGNGMERKNNFSDISDHLRSRYYGNYLEPLDSVGSSLRAQLYRECSEIEEYVYNSLPWQSTPTVRPLLLTDGGRIIGRASRDFTAENEMQLLSKKLKTDIRRRSRRFSMLRESVQPFHSQGFVTAPLPGLTNAKLLFFLGISVGIMFTILINKREVENLNELLMKNENLVRDLQEELEMKDLLNVKENANEDLESLGTNEHHLLTRKPFALNTKQESDVHNEGCGEEPNDQKAEKAEEAMSKIEAELVAELERLQLNIWKSHMELDADFVEDVCNIKLDKANGESSGLSDSDCDVSGTSSDHPDATNYGVSPQELSLHLHKVIQSSLEARIKELETALENSQMRLHSLVLESIIPRKDYGEEESSSQESHAFIDEDSNNDDSRSQIFRSRPRYVQEAYEEISRTTHSVKES